MRTIHFTNTTIQKITECGLEYVDDEGHIRNIDFETCRNHNVESINGRNRARLPGHLYIDSPETWKYVAMRNSIGDPPWQQELHKNSPFIEFYTRPPTRFEFAASEDGHKEFYQLRSLIEQVGWLTFDAS